MIIKVLLKNEDGKYTRILAMAAVGEWSWAAGSPRGAVTRGRRGCGESGQFPCETCEDFFNLPAAATLPPGTWLWERPLWRAWPGQPALQLRLGPLPTTEPVFSVGIQDSMLM